MQTCPKCRETKALSEFQRSHGAGKRRSGRQSYCRECVRAYHREWACRNPDRAKANHAKWRAKRREVTREKRLLKEYGVTLEWYRTQAALQGGQCAICSKVASLDIDHDHATGAVRGLLCRQCNHGIGLFGDSPERLAAAIDYLMKRMERIA